MKSAFPQTRGWPRHLEPCDRDSCAYWKGHSCEHRIRRCEKFGVPCTLPWGHEGGCGAPPEFMIDRSQRKSDDVAVHLNVGSDIHWISVCGYAEREPAAKYACGKEPVTCEWCKALILVAEAKVKEEIDRLHKKSRTDAAEIHHLYAQLERADKDRRKAHDAALAEAIKIAEDFSGTPSDREVAFMIANRIRNGLGR